MQNAPQKRKQGDASSQSSVALKRNVITDLIRDFVENPSLCSLLWHRFENVFVDDVLGATLNSSLTVLKDAFPNASRVRRYLAMITQQRNYKQIEIKDVLLWLTSYDPYVMTHEYLPLYNTWKQDMITQGKATPPRGKSPSSTPEFMLTCLELEKEGNYSPPPGEKMQKNPRKYLTGF